MIYLLFLFYIRKKKMDIVEATGYSTSDSIVLPDTIDKMIDEGEL